MKKNQHAHTERHRDIETYDSKQGRNWNCHFDKDCTENIVIFSGEELVVCKALKLGDSFVYVDVCLRFVLFTFCCRFFSLSTVCTTSGIGINLAHVCKCNLPKFPFHKRTTFYLIEVIIWTAQNLAYSLFTEIGTSTENLHFMATATTHLYFNYLITQERKKTNNGANFLNGIANTCQQKSRKNSLVVNIMHWKILFCVNWCLGIFEWTPCHVPFICLLILCAKLFADVFACSQTI